MRVALFLLLLSLIHKYERYDCSVLKVYQRKGYEMLKMISWILNIVQIKANLLET